MVSGWGTISSGGSISNTLKYVKVPPVSDATCNAADSYAGSIVSDKMICAGETIIHHKFDSWSYFPLTQVWLLAARTRVRATVEAPWSPRPLV